MEKVAIIFSRKSLELSARSWDGVPVAAGEARFMTGWIGTVQSTSSPISRQIDLGSGFVSEYIAIKLESLLTCETL